MLPDTPRMRAVTSDRTSRAALKSAAALCLLVVLTFLFCFVSGIDRRETISLSRLSWLLAGASAIVGLAIASVAYWSVSFGYASPKELIDRRPEVPHNWLLKCGIFGLALGLIFGGVATYALSVSVPYLAGSITKQPGKIDEIIRNRSARRMCRAYARIAIASGDEFPTCIDRLDLGVMDPAELSGQSAVISIKSNWLGSSVTGISVPESGGSGAESQLDVTDKS